MEYPLVYGPGLHSTSFSIWVHLYKSESECESDVPCKLLHCSRLCVYTREMFERQKIKEKIAFTFAFARIYRNSYYTYWEGGIQEWVTHTRGVVEYRASENDSLTFQTPQSVRTRECHVFGVCISKHEPD